MLDQLVLNQAASVAVNAAHDEAVFEPDDLFVAEYD
jgi:hypothetical protein